jgi:hypothetical protein
VKNLIFSDHVAALLDVATAAVEAEVNAEQDEKR